MKICVCTLGCKVNQYESGIITRELTERGHEIVDSGAELYIVNTCAVTNEAEKKSRQLVAKLSRENPQAKIVVCGCSSENAAERFYRDGRLIIGTSGKAALCEHLTKEGILVAPTCDSYEENGSCLTDRVRQYVKIQDGCDNFCSYCIVPYLRGRSRSRKVDDILLEVETAAKTAKEIVITGIDISSFGKGTAFGLAELMPLLKSERFRVRLGSLEVGVISEHLLDALANMPNFCPHFHLSLQSGSAGVLVRMNRRYTPSEYFDKVRLIRSVFKDASITTDIIAGFPTETDQEHAETLAFAEAVGFSDIHVFSYSKRNGTAAAKLPQLAGGVVRAREADLTALKTQLKAAYIEDHIGKTQEVLIEEYQGGYAVGYTRNYLRAYVDSLDTHVNSIVLGTAAEPYLEGVVIRRT